MSPMFIFGTWPRRSSRVVLAGDGSSVNIAVSAWDVPAIVRAGCCAATLFAFLRFTRWGQFIIAVSDNA